jgi:hypothetical protein
MSSFAIYFATYRKERNLRATHAFTLSIWEVAGFAALNPDEFIRHLLRCIS